MNERKPLKELKEAVKSAKETIGQELKEFKENLKTATTSLQNGIKEAVKNAKTALEKELDRFYKRILSHKTVRVCLYIDLIIFIPGLILALLIATIMGYKDYNLFQNFISDLGSERYTPAPYLLNGIFIITGLFFVPVFLYFEEIIVSGLNRNNEIPNLSEIAKIIAKLGKISLMMGALGLLGIGVFSEDFSPFDLHTILAVLTFGGFIAGAGFSGFIVVTKKTLIPKIIGYYMLTNSLVILILYFVNTYPFTLPFLEWLLLISINVWTIPSSIILLRHLNQKIAACESEDIIASNAIQNGSI